MQCLLITYQKSYLLLFWMWQEYVGNEQSSEGGDFNCLNSIRFNSTIFAILMNYFKICSFVFFFFLYCFSCLILYFCIYLFHFSAWPLYIFCSYRMPCWACGVMEPMNFTISSSWLPCYGQCTARIPLKPYKR